MKKKLSDYITFKPIGECDINTKEVVKHFNLCCRICEVDGKFELIEYTPRMKQRRIKVAIHKEDAEEIITKLRLRPFSTTLFKRITYWVAVGI